MTSREKLQKRIEQLTSEAHQSLADSNWARNFDDFQADSYLAEYHASMEQVVDLEVIYYND